MVLGFPLKTAKLFCARKASYKGVALTEATVIKSKHHYLCGVKHKGTQIAKRQQFSPTAFLFPPKWRLSPVHHQNRQWSVHPHWDPSLTDLGMFHLVIQIPAVSGALRGFPGGARGTVPAYQCQRGKRCGFHPCVGKIPERRTWQPTPVFLPGESHGQRSLAGYSP